MSGVKKKKHWLKHKRVSPTYKKVKGGKVVSVKIERWGGELGEVCATLCSARLLLCSSPTIPDVAHTPQSKSFSSRKHRPAGHARHQTPLQNLSSFFFLSFCLSFFSSLWKPIIWISWSILWYCCANIKPWKYWEAVREFYALWTSK